MGNITFTDQERADALRRAAAWCRDGAPGGRTGQVFHENGPCAIGKALLELNDDIEGWLTSGLGKDDYCDALVGDNSIARLHLSHVPGSFDTHNLIGAATALELTAEDLVPA